MKWMERYALAFPHVNEYRRSVWWREGMLLATDAKCLLCVSDHRGSDAAELAPLPEEGEKGWARSAWLMAGEPTRHDASVTTLGDLWAWLDRVELEHCALCFDYKGLCPMCEESGEQWPPVWRPREPDERQRDRDTVLVAGAHLERNRLAWWLAPELGDAADPVAVQPGPVSDSAAFIGNCWKLFVKGLDYGPCRVKGRAYRTYLPGAGAWWECRRSAPAEVHPALDWFAERGLEGARFAFGDAGGAA